MYYKFIGFGSQEGWITTDIKTYTTNSKTVSTHQHCQMNRNQQLSSMLHLCSSVSQSNRLNVVIYLDQC